MRIPRSVQLHPNTGLVHKIWRCHNKEFLLASSKIKNMYLDCSLKALSKKNLENKISIFSICIMNNHCHKGVTYSDTSQSLSEYMRMAHTSFGMKFNKYHNRTGKVANERPKTPLIQDWHHAMQVQFYIEANPIRAGINTLGNLQYNSYSSYGFYAYGVTNKLSSLLTIPQWYLELGQTPKERQRKYRKLFALYIKENGIFKSTYASRYIGTEAWQTTQYNFSKKLNLARYKINNSS